jgi:Fe-S-cluster containining protein
VNLLIPPNTYYECQSSGRCCSTDWNVGIKDSKWSRLRDAGLTVPVWRSDFGSLHLLSTSGSCDMLDSKSLCRIHGRFGPEFKPTACRIFPFIFTPTPEGVCVALSFLCPTVRANRGPALSEQLEQITSLAKESEAKQTLHSPFTLYESFTTGWRGYFLWESELLRRLEESPVLSTLQRAARGLQLQAQSWGRAPIEVHFPEQADVWSQSSLEDLASQLERKAQPYYVPEKHGAPEKLPQRYIAHLIHGKFLLRQPSLFDGLRLLCAVLIATGNNNSGLVAALEMVLTHGQRKDVSQFTE